MTTFWRNYSDRVSHWATRDEWGHVTHAAPSARIKDDWVYKRVRDKGDDGSGVMYSNATCPECRKDVYFYRHPSGGCAWFDDIPWPWPKHDCMDKRSTRCVSDNPDITETGELKSDACIYPKLPDWVKFRGKRTYSSHKEQATRPTDAMDLKSRMQSYYRSPLGEMKRVSAFQFGLPHPQTERLSSSYAFGAPHRQAKQIFRHLAAKGECPFKHWNTEEGFLFVIPLTLLRSVQMHGKIFIAARSFALPDIGLWLQVEVGMRGLRNIHGLLNWTPDDPCAKIVSFVDPQTARMNWREIVSIDGAFNKVPR